MLNASTDPVVTGQESDRLLIIWMWIAYPAAFVAYAMLRFDLPPLTWLRDLVVDGAGPVARRYWHLQRSDPRSGDGYLATLIGFLTYTIGNSIAYVRLHRSKFKAKGLHQAFPSAPRVRVFLLAIVLSFGFYLLFLADISWMGSPNDRAAGFFYFPGFMIFGVLYAYFGSGLLLLFVTRFLRLLGPQWRL